MTTQTRLNELHRIAHFMTNDPDLWVFRRYEMLHIINILALQQRMSKLEQDLMGISNYEASQAKGQEYPKPEKSPEVLLAEIQDVVKAYDDALLSLARIKSTETPAEHVADSLKKFALSNVLPSLLTALSPNWMEGSNTPRLLSIATPQRSWLHRYIDRHECLSSVFKEKGNTSSFMTKYSESKLRNTEFGVVTASLCLVQLLPVMALTLVTDNTVRIAVVLILIFIVSLLNALFANTARASNFGAVAAYVNFFF
ncbi:uncharacterized protein BDZ99DRAFT_475685 [Mytilinidion resinicola]|uniref:DUF6594 domain-containing protein n=1 Tax=Mytilinidion resinicola TaxID=574789 RepID=A0A6A6YPI5_9PEZI|nr:uncharacterized protein BDZ99DRAFT_475685 [Mytilinidion resinicola]KAF2810806.1 hypothetical protein BDZ99DRAFT_475685 [Mytilinidion resinicola]